MLSSHRAVVAELKRGLLWWAQRERSVQVYTQHIRALGSTPARCGKISVVEGDRLMYKSLDESGDYVLITDVPVEKPCRFHLKYPLRLCLDKGDYAVSLNIV